MTIFRTTLIAFFIAVFSVSNATAQSSTIEFPGMKLGAAALGYGAVKTCLNHKITCAIAGTAAVIVGNKVLKKVRGKSSPDEYCTEGYDRIFRVVSRNEGADIEASGRYNVGFNSYEGKQFWTRIDDAVWFHIKTLSYEDARAGRLLVTSLACKSTISAAFTHPDGEADRIAITFDTSLLERVNFDAHNTSGIKVIKALPWSKQ